jgi:hypothetical protein
MRLQALILSGVLLAVFAAPSAWASPRRSRSSSGVTEQLYQLLNNSYGGRLADFYVLANAYPDPQNPQNRLQHVLSVSYNKKLFFGRFVIVVRSIAKPTPAQLKTYTAKQLFNFGETDLEKFEKIRAGRFGSEGDLYLRSSGGGPLAGAPITEEVNKEYDAYITRYLLPALVKKN